MQSVFNCCHEGAGMAFGSKGNLYITNGDNVPNGSNSTNGGYTNPDPQYTIPCPSATVLPNWNTHCGQTPEGDRLRPAGTKLYSYGDVRSTSGDTCNYLGKTVRILPLDDPGSAPVSGTTYTITDVSAPNGANLSPPDSPPVRSAFRM